MDILGLFYQFKLIIRLVHQCPGGEISFLPMSRMGDFRYFPLLSLTGTLVGVPA